MLGRWGGRIGVGPVEGEVCELVLVWLFVAVLSCVIGDGEEMEVVTYVADYTVVQWLVGWLVKLSPTCYADQKVWVIWFGGHRGSNLLW